MERDETGQEARWSRTSLIGGRCVGLVGRLIGAGERLPDPVGLAISA
jgi:hypothetical protein